jgi:hypothetical protein
MGMRKLTSVLSTTNVTCGIVGTPRIGGVAFVVVIKVHLRRTFRFGWRFRHHLITEGAIVEAKATAAADIFISYHSPVYVAVYALSRECRCIASPVSFPRLSVRPWSTSRKAHG